MTGQKALQLTAMNVIADYESSGTEAGSVSTVQSISSNRTTKEAIIWDVISTFSGKEEAIIFIG